MKNFLFTAVAILFISVSSMAQNLTAHLQAFKTNFPLEHGALDYSKQQQDSNGRFVTIPVIKQGVVTGRFYSHGSSAIFIRLTHYTQKITIINILAPTENQTIGTTYDSRSMEYNANVNELKVSGTFWCKTSCIVGAAAIAASDGPAPLMDVLAVTYAATCLAACDE